jgi:hypothetical protein
MSRQVENGDRINQDRGGEEPREVLPRTGLVFHERTALQEVLCKPKIMPLKSTVLQQLEKLEVVQKEAAIAAAASAAASKAW